MKKRILAVDDEKDILDMLEALLSNAGYEIMRTSSGQEAIAMAKNHHPDLMLLDVKMPGIDGVQLLDMLKNDRATRDIPIIYLTSLVKTDDLEDGYVKGSKIGGLHFVAKSSSSDELLRVIRQEIGQ